MTRNLKLTVLASLLSMTAIIGAPAVAAATTDTASAATSTSHTVISADGPSTTPPPAPHDIHW